MYHVSAQGVDERMINVHYYYYYCILSKVRLEILRQPHSVAFGGLQKKKKHN